MKKLNRKGFTLIELLAVITIMGILMIVAVPAMSRTIENSRRGTFANTAQSYVNAVKNAVAANELSCGGKDIQEAGAGYYYTGFTTGTGETAKNLLEQGGKSSWGNAQVAGQVYIHKTVTNGKTYYEYAITITDADGHGIGKGKSSSGNPTYVVSEKNIKRSNVNASDGDNRSLQYTKITASTNLAPSSLKWDDTSVTSATACTISS